MGQTSNASRPAQTAQTASVEELVAIVQELHAIIARLENTVAEYANENTLLKHRLFGVKSERGHNNEGQLSFEGLLPNEESIQKQLDELTAKEGDANSDGKTAEETSGPSQSPSENKPRPKPKGRRDLSTSTLPRIVVEIRDHELERTCRLIGWESSLQLMHERSRFKVLDKRIAKYELKAQGEVTVVAAEPPKQLFPRALLHTSLLAWLVVEKFARGVPHYRLEQLMCGDEVTIDRGTMCRNVEEVGNTLGSTVVCAMMRDALENSGVLSTDATSAMIQPAREPKKDGKLVKRNCRKGHFFTIVSDRDHVLFVFHPNHTQAAVEEMFRGYRGYLQSDAHSVYDILERAAPNESGCDPPIKLVGCWSHCRRYFFEAALCRQAIGVEGLVRIRAIFRADERLRHLTAEQRYTERIRYVRPLVEHFFEWVESHHQRPIERGVVARAIGYAHNQATELRRVMLDGRLPLDNNRSERALRKIVVGRKNWMFYGSHVHAEAAAALFSLIASCRLHRQEPQRYLSEVMRVLPYWPTDRYLELAPKHWAATRARLDAKQLDAPVGAITVPEREA